MLRRVVPLLSPTFRDLAERLDSFEKEVIELKAFRQAVEMYAPDVANAATTAAELQIHKTNATQANLENPLTAQEFVDLTQFYALQQPRRIKIENLLYITTPDHLVAHAAVVHREYLVRIAHSTQTLSSAPYGLSQMPSIKELKHWYQWSFHDMHSTPSPQTLEDCLAFDGLVRRVFLRHFNVSGLLSAGMQELATREQWTDIDEELMETYEGMSDFFTDFCTGRVTLRLLVGNYMYLSNKILSIPSENYKDYDVDGLTVPLFFDHNPEDFAGQICKKCSMLKLLRCAIRESQKEYEEAEIELNLSGEEDLTFVGIPYIIFDVLTAMIGDAIQANMYRQETYGISCTNIIVTLAQRKGNRNYVVLISDTAGGMRLNHTDTLLSCWSTYKSLKETSEDTKINSWSHSPIRLPYAYCAARSFGGDISVASIEGYGTDRLLYMPAIGGTSRII